jgi:hypothetical protein
MGILDNFEAWLESELDKQDQDLDLKDLPVPKVTETP